MSTQYLDLHVPYFEKESVFLMHAIQSAVKAHRHFQEQAAIVAGSRNDQATDDSPKLPELRTSSSSIR